MRFSYFIALLSLAFLFSTSQNARAAVWVEQITGNSEAILIARSGNFLKIKEMMRLQPGDVVKVRDDKVSVRILLGSGAVKNISRAESPYTVAGKGAGNSFLSNLMGEVKKMLVASSDQTQAVAMMTRGKGKQLAILAEGDEQNMVLAGSRQLVIGWRGGKAPYNLSFIDVDNDETLASKGEVSEQRWTIDTAKLAKEGLVDGDYEILVKDTGAKSHSATEKKIAITVVGRDELSDDAIKLLELRLDDRVEARFLINLLHKDPKWRFFAYSLAVRHGLETERVMLQLMN